MSQTSEYLNQVRRKLGQQVTAILETALACDPPGTSSEQWRTLMNELGITELPASSEEAASQTKGAPLEDVQRCLEAQVASLRSQYPDVDDAMGATLETLVSRHTEQYRGLSTVKPFTGGGMFGFAMATAQVKAGEKKSQGTRYVLHCPDCGGPRLKDSDLVCEYCSGRTSS